MKLSIQLKSILNERNMTQKELSEKSGVRTNIISELANNQRTSINREYVARIADTLEITDMNELFIIERN